MTRDDIISSNPGVFFGTEARHNQNCRSMIFTTSGMIGTVVWRGSKAVWIKNGDRNTASIRLAIVEIKRTIREEKRAA